MPQSASCNRVMEDASVALVEMRYAECERLCLQALGLAREESDFIGYSRALLPLQEARRQRRQAASDLLIRFGSSDLPTGEALTEAVLDEPAAGCLILTSPHDSADATRLMESAESQGRPFEVLLVNDQAGASNWHLQAINHKEVVAEMEPPSPLDVWRRSDAFAHAFVEASERLGDAALAQVEAKDLDGIERLTQLEQMVDAVPDHEKLHQALADAARTLIRACPQ